MSAAQLWDLEEVRSLKPPACGKELWVTWSWCRWRKLRLMWWPSIPPLAPWPSYGYLCWKLKLPNRLRLVLQCFACISLSFHFDTGNRVSPNRHQEDDSFGPVQAPVKKPKNGKVSWRRDAIDFWSAYFLSGMPPKIHYEAPIGWDVWDAT